MSSFQEKGDNQVPELKQNIMILRDIPFFEGFPTEVLKLLAYLCVRGDYEDGDILFERGDDEGLAFYILSGEMALYRDKDGREEQLRSYQPGEFIGGFSLVGPMPALFTLKAKGKTQLLILTRDQFGKVLEQHLELRPVIKKAMLSQLRRWEKMNIEELDSCCLRKVGVTLL